MKTLTKLSLGAAMLTGAMLAAAPASAQVSVGIGFGGGYYAPPRPVCPSSKHLGQSRA